jgi:hypothetical protein
MPAKRGKALQNAPTSQCTKQKTAQTQHGLLLIAGACGNSSAFTGCANTHRLARAPPATHQLPLPSRTCVTKEINAKSSALLQIVRAPTPVRYDGVYRVTAGFRRFGVTGFIQNWLINIYDSSR